MKNRFAGKCARCGQTVLEGAGTVEKFGNQWIVTHVECPEITSGLGIGGVGSDDHNIHSSDVGLASAYVPGNKPAGTQVCPAGTTDGQSNPGARCARCGKPADWNPSAGENLCPRHWDEY